MRPVAGGGCRSWRQTFADSRTHAFFLQFTCHLRDGIAHALCRVGKACEIGAHLLLKATKVDGIYSADPKKDPALATRGRGVPCGDRHRRPLSRTHG